MWWLIAVAPVMTPPDAGLDAQVERIESASPEVRDIRGVRERVRWPIEGGQATCTRLRLMAAGPDSSPSAGDSGTTSTTSTTSATTLALVPIAYDAVYRSALAPSGGGAAPGPDAERSPSGALDHRRIEASVTIDARSTLQVRVTARHHWQTFRLGRRFASVPLAPLATEGVGQWSLHWRGDRWEADPPVSLADGCD